MFFQRVFQRKREGKGQRRLSETEGEAATGRRPTRLS